MKKADLTNGMEVQLRSAEELVQVFASTNGIAEGERGTLAGKLREDKGAIENIFPADNLFDFKSEVTANVTRIPIDSIRIANGEAIEDAEVKIPEPPAAQESTVTGQATDVSELTAKLAGKEMLLAETTETLNTTLEELSIANEMLLKLEKELNETKEKLAEAEVKLKSGKPSLD